MMVREDHRVQPVYYILGRTSPLRSVYAGPSEADCDSLRQWWFQRYGEWLEKSTYRDDENHASRR